MGLCLRRQAALLLSIPLELGLSMEVRESRHFRQVLHRHW
jgi:hypothetical protein